jgi:hypothetical protein
MYLYYRNKSLFKSPKDYRCLKQDIKDVKKFSIFYLFSKNRKYFHQNKTEKAQQVSTLSHLSLFIVLPASKKSIQAKSLQKKFPLFSHSRFCIAS